MILRTLVASLTIVFGLFGAVDSWASPGVSLGPPESMNGNIPYVQCDRTTCFETGLTRSQTIPDRPADSSAVYPSVVGPPAGQRYRFKANTPGCEIISLAATASNPQVYVLTTPIPVPLGSTHVSLYGSMEASLIGSGANGVATMFGQMQIRRAATDTDPAGSWIKAVTGYVYTRSGTNMVASRFGRSTYEGLENLSELPPIGNVPSSIEVRLVANQFTGGGFTYDATLGIPSPGICRGNLLVTF